MRPRPLSVFLAVVLLIVGAALWFCGSQLAGAFPLGGPGVWAAWTWALALWAFPATRVILFRGSQGRVQDLAFFLLGLASTLTVLLLLLRALGLALAPVGWAWPLWAPWVMLAVSALFCIWGLFTALGPATVREMRLATAGLHPDLEGLRVVQISDLHVSHLNGPDQVARLVAQVQDLKPDLIAVTGDLVDGPCDSLRAAAQPLRGLNAPLGVHYVTGNHEYYWGLDAWLEVFAGLGFELLLNEHHVVSRGKATLLVLGVTDPTAERMGHPGPDLERARAGAPKADYTLFLAHQPQAYLLAEAAQADLFLAGHTHGGQFFPFPPIVRLFHRYFRGLYRHGTMDVYIHAGSGFWGPQNRLGVPPEIALFILERAPAKAGQAG